jgi:transposase
LDECGHEVLVVDPSSIVGKKKRKADKIDAERLARLGRDPRKVTLVRHRSPQAQADLAILRTRDLLVRQRTSSITHTRGIVKAFGARLPEADSEAFAKRVRSEIPPELELALLPMLDLIAGLTKQIRTYDRLVEQLCKERYPETALMRQIRGVGPIASLTVRLVLDDPMRFRKSRQVGAYVGLVPGLAAIDHPTDQNSRASSF